jgi:hypothetical protein
MIVTLSLVAIAVITPPCAYSPILNVFVAMINLFCEYKGMYNLFNHQIFMQKKGEINPLSLFDSN